MCCLNCQEIFIVESILIFFTTIQSSVEKTYPSRENPVLLILEGHHTHDKNLIARNSSDTISLHAFHEMRPLDKTVMSTLKI